MKKSTRMIGVLVSGLAAATVLSAGSCSTAADVASQNLSTAADNFEIERRIVFFNGITDTNLLEIRGRCSIEDQGNQLEVTCKVGPDEYKKEFLGLSDNVSYFSEQIGLADVNEYNYRVIFRPDTIVPAPEVRTSRDTDQ